MRPRSYVQLEGKTSNDLAGMQGEGSVKPFHCCFDMLRLLQFYFALFTVQHGYVVNALCIYFKGRVD